MMKKLSLTSQIAIALVLAVVAGILVQGHADFVNKYIQPLGNIFLNLLKFIVVPLVLFSIVAGVDRIVDMGRTVMSITGDASCAVIMQNRFSKASS
jgi:Na+/H+-dicarboxylate symporter